MPLERQHLENLDRPAAPAGPLGPEAALRVAVCADLLAPRPWLALGRLLLEQAVAADDESPLGEAQACLDLGRLLALPWDQPPELEAERLCWIRRGRPARADWPSDDDPSAARRAAIAFCTGEPPATSFAAGFYHGPPIAFTVAERTWIELAVTARLGDAEERARRLEWLRALPAVDLAPGWLARSHGDHYRARIRGGLAELRQSLRRTGGLRGLVAGGWLPAFRHLELPVAVAEMVLAQPAARSPVVEAALLGRLTEVASRLDETSGAGLRQALGPRLAGLPYSVVTMLRSRSLPWREGSAGGDRLLNHQLARTAPRRKAALLHGAALAFDPARDLEGAGCILRALAAEPTISPPLRVRLTCRILAGSVNTHPSARRGIITWSQSGWSNADDHDTVMLAVLDLLLRSAAAGDPNAYELARHYGAQIDRAPARAGAALRLAASAPVPAETERLATDCLRRLRAESAPVELIWPLRIEAARLLVRLGHAEGSATLLDAASRLTGWLGRRADWPRALLARALAEALPAHPEARLPLERVADAVGGGLPRWLAAVYAGREPGRLPRRLPATVDLELALAGGARRLDPAGGLWRRLVELAEPCPAAVADRRLTRPERLAALARKDLSAAEVLLLGRLAEEPRQPEPRAMAALLAGEALEELAARRADAATAEARRRLAAAYADRLAAVR